MNANEPPTPEAEARLAAFLTAQLGREPSPDTLWQRLAPHLSTPSAPGERDLMEQPTPGTSTFTNTPLAHKPLSRAPMWRIIPAAAAALIVVLVATIFATLHEQHKASIPARGTSSTVPTVTGTGMPPGAAPQAILTGVSLSTPTDGWAVGWHDSIPNDTTGASRRPLAYHLVNGMWMMVPLPSTIPNTIDLLAISFDSPTDGWAVGLHGFLHYNGSTWSYLPSPLGARYIAVQMLAPNVGWAVGMDTTATSSHGVIISYDGSHWTQQAIPALNGAVALSDVAMLSPQEGWVVGSSTDATTTSLNGVKTAIVLHWHNGAWTLQQHIAGSSLNSIDMISTTDGWAVGVDQAGNPLIYHYQGGTWLPFTIANYPTTGGFTYVRMVSPTDGWITGATTSTEDVQKSLTLLHYDGTTWHQVPTPSFNQGSVHARVMSLAIAGSSVWAVGYVEHALQTSSSDSSLSITPLIMHLVNGVWVVVQS